MPTRWFDVAPPHDDIQDGDFDESVFAAKLGDVVDGVAPPDYNRADLFYRKTYLTAGLEDLLQRMHRRLVEGKGPGVVQLQTPFGGGKTHALILAYHYLENGAAIEGRLPEGVGLVEDADVAVVVGKDANASEGFRTGGGYTRQTLWGEMAYQLGGDTAFEKVRRNDENRTAPGRADLRDMLEPLQPFVILLDEVLEYVVRARGVKVEESTLGAQTLSFFDELTEAVAGLKNGMLIATLPSSEQEDFGDGARSDLGTIEKIFGRQQAIYTPVESQEVYSIIRQRLFAAVDDDAASDVVDRYVQFYQTHADAVPDKATTTEYRDRMERSYPFHPEVIDILYEKWSTFQSFQRTRGALQLLARVVENLYESGEPIDLILPGDVDLSDASIRSGFLEHLTPQHKGIVASDVVGGDGKSRQLDRSHRTWNGLAVRAATAIFLHSFTADAANRGIGETTVKLDVARPDDNVALVDTVLTKQSRTLWYLNTRGDRYYFSNVPNLNRMVVDKKALVGAADVRDALRERVAEHLGEALRPYAWPSSSREIPDDAALKLVVWDPQRPSADADLRAWVQKRGDNPRVYKNTLLFALPDDDRHTRLQDRIREHLALVEIRDEIDEGEHPALEGKKGDVRRRIRTIENEYSQKVREVYREAAVPVDNGSGGIERVNLGTPPADGATLSAWFADRLSSRTSGKIQAQPPSPAFLREKFLAGRTDPLPLREAVDQFFKDVRLPMLRDESLIAEGVADGVTDGFFGLARREEGAEAPDVIVFQEPYRAERVPLTEAGWELVPEETARDWKQAAQEEREEGVDERDEGRGGKGEERRLRGENGEEAASVGDEADGRGEGAGEERTERVRMRVTVSSSQMADVLRGVIRPLQSEAGDFAVTLEIDVAAEEGISDRVVEQQVRETLRQLGAEVEGIG